MKNSNKKVNKKIKPMKPFNTVQEEALFWDTHDLSNVFKDSKIALSKLSRLEKEKEAVLTIRIQKSVKEKIEKVARAKGVNPGTLSRVWLIEKLQQAV